MDEVERRNQQNIGRDMVGKMQGWLAGSGVEEPATVQGVPGDLIVDAQIKAAGVEAQVTQHRQPEKGGNVEQNQTPGQQGGPMLTQPDTPIRAINETRAAMGHRAIEVNGNTPGSI